MPLNKKLFEQTSMQDVFLFFLTVIDTKLILSDIFGYVSINTIWLTTKIEGNNKFTL